MRGLAGENELNLCIFVNYNQMSHMQTKVQGLLDRAEFMPGSLSGYELEVRPVTCVNLPILSNIISK